MSLAFTTRNYFPSSQCLEIGLFVEGRPQVCERSKTSMFFLSVDCWILDLKPLYIVLPFDSSFPSLEKYFNISFLYSQLGRKTKKYLCEALWLKGFYLKLLKIFWRTRNISERGRGENTTHSIHAKKV